MEYTLSEKEIEVLSRKRGLRYSVVLDYKAMFDPSGEEGMGWKYIEIVPSRIKGVCFCKKAKGTPQDTPFCKHCGKSFLHGDLISTKDVFEKGIELAQEQSKQSNTSGWFPYHTHGKSCISLAKFFYIKKHPEHEEGLVIYYIAPTVKMNNKTGVDTFDMKIERAIEIVPNSGYKAYKLLKNGNVEMDLFDAMQINSQTMRDGFSLEFEDSNKVIDFMLKNKKIAKYTGFLECFNQVETTLSRTAFFMLYLYIYAQYPVVELLVKMGYISLIKEMLVGVSLGCNKARIRERAENLNKLINPETTRGSMALTIPKYISDNLNENDARLEEYVLWSDINEISGGISKERYEKIISSTEFHVCNSTWMMRSMPEMLAYGYTLEEVFKYLRKVGKDNYSVYNSVFSLLKDYNHMCDLMQVAPDKFPADIKKAHDNLSLAFKAKQDAICDASINRVANSFEKQVKAINETISEEYIVSMPYSAKDVIAEGQAMHNCVGSYVSKIASNKSIIFFIRRREKPDESFITAECINGNLTQLYYKNNRPVHDLELRKIGTAFCELVKKKTV